MYQNLCHDLALTIAEMSRCAADELEQENAVYRNVVQQRDNAARALQQQLPEELLAAWNQYQTLTQRYQFMEQEVQFFKGCCSYSLIIEHFCPNTVSHRQLLSELLDKFR